MKSNEFRLVPVDDYFGAPSGKSDIEIKLVPTPFLPETKLSPKEKSLYEALGSSSSTNDGGSFEKFLLAEPKNSGDFFGPGSPFTKGTTADFQFKLPQPEKPDYAGLGDSPRPEAEFTKGAAADFQKFVQFTKIQETGDGDAVVYGIATAEKPDLDGEICSYDEAKRAYQTWSTAAVQRTSGAGQEISLGPIRFQHSVEPAGKAVKIDYNDDAKEIWLGSIPINDDVRKQLQQGYLTGYSQGGSYAWRRCADCNKSLGLQQANNYCPDCKRKVAVRYGLGRLSEVSYVDSPCSGQGFQYVKVSGETQFVTFTKKPATEPAAARETIKVVKLLGDEKVRVSLGGLEWNIPTDLAVDAQRLGILTF